MSVRQARLLRVEREPLGSDVNGRGPVDAATQHVQAADATGFLAERKSEQRWARREV
jgi:hypothetical protein